jgi:Flp pilus assembly protein CpaB
MLLQVPVGALIPAAAVGTGTTTDIRMVTVPVDPLHAPTDLASGDRVDVWATQNDGAQTTSAPPVLALASVLVVSADHEDVGMGGEIAVVLEVPADQVSVVVAAVRAGSIDLAAVPMTAARP